MCLHISLPYLPRLILSKVAKRKTLFDDRPVEISVRVTAAVTRSLVYVIQELTFIIKQDIAGLNKEIAKLQSHVKQKSQTSSKSAEAKQIDEHNNNVVMLLQSKLANASVTFKDVLELRTQVRLPPPGLFAILMAPRIEHEGVER